MIGTCCGMFFIWSVRTIAIIVIQYLRSLTLNDHHNDIWCSSFDVLWQHGGTFFTLWHRMCCWILTASYCLYDDWIWFWKVQTRSLAEITRSWICNATRMWTALITIITTLYPIQISTVGTEMNATFDSFCWHFIPLLQRASGTGYLLTHRNWEPSFWLFTIYWERSLCFTLQFSCWDGFTRS